MRISRIIYVLLISSIILFMGAMSCDNDNGVDANKNESIIGTWALDQVIMKGTPVGNLEFTGAQFLELSGLGATSSTMQFNEDGTASVTTTYVDKDDEIVPGTWSQDGRKLIISGAGIDDTVGFDLDGNTLTLMIMMPIDFDSDGVAEDTAIDMIYAKQ